jgi:hypothetical protein
MRVDRRACLGNGAPSENAKQVTASKAVQCNQWSDFMIQFFRLAGGGGRKHHLAGSFSDIIFVPPEMSVRDRLDTTTTT